MELLIHRMDDRAKLPFQGSAESVGFDLHAFLLSESGRPNTALIPPKMTKIVRTGICVQPPPGHTVFICSRSGLASRSLFVTNAPGVIDPDYRGEVFILLYNGGYESHYVKHEDRIAQLLVLPTPEIMLKEVDGLSVTVRGAAGLGSTGS